MSRLFESVDFRNCLCNWTQSGWWSEEYRPTINPHIPTILGAYFRRAGAYLTVRKLTTIATCCLFHWSGQIWLYPARIPACLWQLLNAAPFPGPWMESPSYPRQVILTIGKLFPLRSNGPIRDGHGVWLREKLYHSSTHQPTSRSVDLCVLKISVSPSFLSLSWELSNY